MSARGTIDRGRHTETETPMTDDHAPSPDFTERAGALVSPRQLPRVSRPGRTPDPDRPVTDFPAFGRVGYLAVSDTELAMFRTSKLGMRPGPKGAPLTRVPLSELAAVGFEERRLVAFLDLRFADDALWSLQIGLINRPAARLLVAELDPALVHDHLER